MKNKIKKQKPKSFKVLWRVIKEAKEYSLLYTIAIISTFLLTAVNLTAPKMLTNLISILEGTLDQNALNQIIVLALVLLGLYLLRVLFRYLSNFLSHFAAWRLVEKVRVIVYEKIQSFSMDFFHNKQTGELMSRVVNDTATFEIIYAHTIPETITSVFTLIGVTWILFSINVKLAFLTLIPVPFIVIASLILIKKVRPNFRNSQRNLAELNAKLQDNFSGIQEIQSFNQEEREKQGVNRRAAEYTKSHLKALNLNAIFHPSVEFLTSLGIVIVVGFGGFFAYNGDIEVVEIVGFLLYLSLFYAPITSLARLIEDSQHALAGAERVIELLDTKVTIVDEPDAIEIEKAEGNIRFENVNFSYIKGRPVLDDVSFEVKAGQMVALVGPTGVGKTTLTQLLDRVYDPTSGVIYLDGINLKKLTIASLRKQISSVLQNSFLFNGTVAENIAYAKPDATMEEIEEAAKTARIHEEILQMPGGYNAYVGERGIKLSGGQKQRLAIARAVLRNTPILLLDEATASVDVETERKIQTAINDIAKTRTIIAIAHRLSTIRKADLIVVFENGKIVERGNHQELIALNGVYKRMCKVQDDSALVSFN